MTIIMQTSDKLLNSELRRDEAVRRIPYKDTEAIWTVGVGHNMKAKPLPNGWVFPLTDAQIDWLLAEDLLTVFAELDGNLSWWRNLSYPRQRVLANMAFNMGVPRLLAFKITLAAMKGGHYGVAATNMLDSKWAKQVGDRAIRLSQLMERG